MHVSEWNASKVSLSSAPNVNATQVFSATDGLTVFKEITNPFSGPGPVMYNKITFVSIVFNFVKPKVFNFREEMAS